MSTSSPSLHDQIHESQPLREDPSSLKPENPNKLDPPPNSHPKTLADPEYNSPEEEEDEEEEGEEIEEGVTITGRSVSVPALTSPSVESSTRRGVYKRKKGKGKGKGKSNARKQQLIDEKVQTLISQLSPIPFVPHKILDFPKHEKLLKKLGLWEFVQLEFDRDIRVDFIAQLVATYEVKSRGSYVNGFRIRVNRADLARAFRLPLKKEKGIVGVMDVDLDTDALSENSLGFIMEFISDWVLLHEDTWMMPNEVIEWLKVIKDGHLEKVDWAGLFWFMVEKELKQGVKLRDCYYASHLQKLIKFQREDLFLVKEVDLEEMTELDAVDVDTNGKEGEGEDVKKSDLVDVDADGKEGEGEDAKNSGSVDVDADGIEGEGGDVKDSGSVDLDADGKEGEGGDVKESGLVDVDTNGKEGEEGDVKEDSGSVDVDADGKEGEGGHLKDGDLVHVDANVKEGEGGDVKDSDLVDVDANGKEGEGGDVKDNGVIDGSRVGGDALEEPSTELTLGDGDKGEEMKDVDMMDVEKTKESDEEEEVEVEEEGQGERQWLLNGKDDHFMQPCDVGIGSFEDRKEDGDEEDGEAEDRDEIEVGEEMEGEGEGEEIDGDEDEEEMGNKFSVFPSGNALEVDGFPGKFLQAMEANPMGFNVEEQILVDARADMQNIASTPSFFNNAGKRVIEHDDDNHISHHSLNNDSNKRLRINDSWDNKPSDFSSCMDQIQQLALRAKMFHDEKEQTLEQLHMNQQIMLAELQKRDNMMEHLHKARLEETEKKDGEVYRLERELCLMGTVLDGYRKALKETQKAFAEYRERAQLPEEPTYKDAGPGGLMLTAVEIEKLEKKRQEEFKMNCLFVEQRMCTAGEEFEYQLHGFRDRVNDMDRKLTDFESVVKRLIEFRACQKNLQTGEKMPEFSEAHGIMAEADETVPIPPTEKEPEFSEAHEIMAEADETLPIPPTEKVPEGAESLQILSTGEGVPNAAEIQPTPEQQEEETILESAEPLQIPQTEDQTPEVAEIP